MADTPYTGDPVWKSMRQNYERLVADAPEGFAARVEVHLNNGEYFEPGNIVETAKSGWIIFEVDQPGEAMTEQRRTIAVRPEGIAKVEVSYVRGERRPVGFSLGPAPEQPSDDGAQAPAKGAAGQYSRSRAME